MPSLFSVMDEVLAKTYEPLTPLELLSVAMSLMDARRTLRRDRAFCIAEGGCGVEVFVRSRVRELHPFKTDPDKQPPEFRLTVELHCWPWDTEAYGPWVDEKFQVPRHLNAARSPVPRLTHQNGSPIDRVSYRVNRRDPMSQANRSVADA